MHEKFVQFFQRWSENLNHRVLGFSWQTFVKILHSRRRNISTNPRFCGCEISIWLQELRNYNGASLTSPTPSWVAQCSVGKNSKWDWNRFRWRELKFRREPGGVTGLKMGMMAPSLHLFLLAQASGSGRILTLDSGFHIYTPHKDCAAYFHTKQASRSSR